MFLRKWSPIKYLMYLWLAILVWIFCRCESAATMHLAPTSSSSSYSPFSLSPYASGTSSSRTSSGSSSSVSSSSDSFSASRNSITELFANRNHYRVPAASPRGDTSELVDSTSPYQWRSTPESTISTQHLTKFISQAATVNRRRSPPPVQVTTSANYHHPINYANRMLQENANKQQQQQLPNLPASLSQSTSNHDSRQVKNSNYANSSSSSISNTSISAESAILAEKRLQQQWMLRISQKRARRLAHRQRLSQQPEALVLSSTTYRNRRDSARLPMAGGSPQNPRRAGGIAGGPGQTRRYCSARDPATLAFDAPVVFEGKVKSMSSDRRANFSVTFEIVRVHKKHTKYPLEMFQQVRLQFSFRNFSECDIYRETYRERGIVREELEQGKVYFLFVKQIDLSNFTILGQPIRKTRRTANGVLEGVKDTYGKPPKIYSITSNVTRQEGKRVRLVCKVQGEPPPKVTWFKDKRSINRNVTKYAQVHLKKRSELIIHSVIPSDAGEYECRAKNKYAKISNSTHLRVAAKHSSTKQPKTTHSTEPPYNPRPCRGPGAEHFCLNGGTCIHFEDLQEWACTCPKGFSGNKCENKVIDYHPTTSSKHQDCSYGYGYGGHPECADFLLMDSPVALPMVPALYDYDDDSDI